MKFGLSVPVQHRPDEPSAERVHELLEQVKLARDLGFDSISASTSAGIKRAARLGDAWTIAGHATLATLKQQVQFYRETLQVLGKPFPIDFPLSKELYIAPERRTALREAQPYLEAKYRAYSQWGQDRELPATETFAVPFETLVQDRFILGDPDDCIMQIRAHQEQLGITHMKFRLHWPGMPHALVMRTIHLLGEKVLPVFR